MLSATVGNAAGHSNPAKPLIPAALPSWSFPAIPSRQPAVPSYDPQPVVLESGPVIPIPSLPAVVAEAAEPVIALPPTPLADNPSLAQEEARNGLPSHLIYAIAIRESGGGQHICAPFNAWGVMEWPNGVRQCRTFTSWAAAISYVAERLHQWMVASGDLGNALCIWNTGQVCAIDGAWYRDEVMQILSGLQH